MNEMQAFQENIYELSKYPIFFLNEAFDILFYPSSFLKVPPTFFHFLHSETTLTDALLHVIFKEEELYVTIPYVKDKVACIIIGPIFYRKMNTRYEIMKVKLLQQLHIQNDLASIEKIPYMQESLLHAIQLTCRSFLHYDIQLSDIDKLIKHRDHSTKFQQLHSQISEEREHSLRSYSYDDEQQLLHYIKTGNSVQARLIGSQLIAGRFGMMSKQRMKHRLYGFIALTALISRTAMNAGAGIEQSYNMSALYMQKAEECTSSKQLYELYLDMILAFSYLVKSNQLDQYPKWIHLVFDYIQRNIHAKITLDEIAASVHMRSSYVSSQFKKITGSSLSQCITDQKMAEACFLIKNTTMSILDISVILGYASQEYFATLFKQSKGVTPSTYRNQVPSLSNEKHS